MRARHLWAAKEGVHCFVGLHPGSIDWEYLPSVVPGVKRLRKEAWAYKHQETANSSASSSCRCEPLFSSQQASTRSYPPDSQILSMPLPRRHRHKRPRQEQRRKKKKSSSAPSQGAYLANSKPTREMIPKRNTKSSARSRVPTSLSCRPAVSK